MLCTVEINIIEKSRGYDLQCNISDSIYIIICDKGVKTEKYDKNINNK
jgi:hypothetical protein